MVLGPRHRCNEELSKVPEFSLPLVLINFQVLQHLQGRLMCSSQGRHNNASAHGCSPLLPQVLLPKIGSTSFQCEMHLLLIATRNSPFSLSVNVQVQHICSSQKSNFFHLTCCLLVPNALRAEGRLCNSGKTPRQAKQMSKEIVSAGGRKVCLHPFFNYFFGNGSINSQ